MSGIAMAAILSGGVASTALDTETVSVGSNFDGVGLSYGYLVSPSVGAINDGIFTPKAATINWLYYYQVTGSQTVSFGLSGIYSDGDWDTMTVGGVSFERTDASFSAASGNTSWTWTVASNPFGTSGAKEVVFT